jgi:hypothetical protein
MKIGIIALCLSLIALGFGVFATVATLGGEDATSLPVAAATWSAEECDGARGTLKLMGLCPYEGTNCGDIGALRLAMNENCP